MWGCAMSQLTLYLDDETAALLKAAAADSGLSRSRWVAEAIRRHAGNAWPTACRQLAGAFADPPQRGLGDEPAMPPDLPRLRF